MSKKQKDSDRFGAVKRLGKLCQAKIADRAARIEEENEIRMPEDVKFFSIRTLTLVLVRRWKCILSIMLCGVLLAGMLIYIPEVFRASAVMSMNFEESAKGKNPNGTRFNLAELRSPEVAKLALELAGLDGKVSQRDIIDGLSISTYITKETELYISSSYYITFKKPFFGMNGVSAEDMLRFICKAYKEKFYNDHIVTAKVLDSETVNYDDMDYSDMSTNFDLVIKRADRYLEMRIGQASSFLDEEGMSFKSLRKKVSNLKDYELASFDSYIWENGIAKDKGFQLDKLAYINHNRGYDMTKAQQGNQIRLKTIDEYNQAMTSSILIPSYDEKYEFYMSRTKTGIDDIAKKADSLLKEEKDITYEMALNYDKIVKMWKPPIQAEYQTADRMAKDIEKKLSDLMYEISEFDNAYMRQSTRNYITFEYTSSSFIRKLHPKRLAAVAVLIFVVMYVYFVVKRKREIRQTLKEIVSPGQKEWQVSGK